LGRSCLEVEGGPDQQEKPDIADRCEGGRTGFCCSRGVGRCRGGVLDWDQLEFGAAVLGSSWGRGVDNIRSHLFVGGELGLCESGRK